MRGLLNDSEHILAFGIVATRAQKIVAVFDSVGRGPVANQLANVITGNGLLEMEHVELCDGVHGEGFVM